MNNNTSTVSEASKVYSNNLREIRRDGTVTANAIKRDEINISRSGKLYQYALQEYEKIPEMRENKVSEIRERIKNGTYEVNSKEIVEKIFEPLHGKY